jgi:hypothetical protein
LQPIRPAAAGPGDGHGHSRRRAAASGARGLHAGRSGSLGHRDDRYELAFLRDIAGANLGIHTVRITTATEDHRGKELLPARYHRHTELTASVVSGDNKLDFPLRSN